MTGLTWALLGLAWLAISLLSAIPIGKALRRADQRNNRHP